MVILTDIDGCLILQNGNMSHQLESTGTLLPGVKEKFNEWSKLGYRIILITARKESAREQTTKQLQEFGLFWDELIMNAYGPRVLINDLKSNSDTPTAIAINLPRNQGLEGVQT